VTTTRLSAALAAYYAALSTWVEAEASALTDQRPLARDWLAAQRQRLDAARGVLFQAAERPL
jgi:hypothetical protein